MDWPEGDEALSEEAVDAVEKLLCLDPASRAKAASLKPHPFFAKLLVDGGSGGEGGDWARLLSVTPPFVPTLDGDSDTTYFEPRNNMQHLKLSEIDMHGL